jgi:hypothetical protein
VIYQATNGSGGKAVWKGRGVNIDDIFLGGANYDLGHVPDAGGTLQTIVSTLKSQWEPTFLRVSLYLDSSGWTQVSWLDAGRSVAGASYKTQMTEVINYITGLNVGGQNVYVLVTLRTDVSMIDAIVGQDGTGLPASGASGTDPVYQALVDSFAGSPYVIFGISNEPGGRNLDAGTIASAMGHAVGVIRNEENRIGLPHHLVAVQGINYTSNLDYYSAFPISWDNVVYEYHAYATPATPYDNIPVIVGEYGPQPAGDNNPGYFDAGGFYAYVEGTNAQDVFIPNLAWDVEPYNVEVDNLVQVTDSGTDLVPAEPWGSLNIDGGVVKTYLIAHAP